MPAPPTINFNEDTDYKNGPTPRALFYDFFGKHFKTRIVLDIGFLIPNPSLFDPKAQGPTESRFTVKNDQNGFNVIKASKNKVLVITPDEFNTIADMVVTSICQYINQHYKTNLVDDFSIISYTSTGIKSYELTFVFDNETIIAITTNSGGYMQANIFTCSDKPFTDLIAFLRQFNQEKPSLDTQTMINIVKHTSSGFEYFSRPIQDYSTGFSLDHYNDDFLPISEKIINSMNSESAKGLVLLYGGVGTGKTSYIKHLISAGKRKVFYIPPDMAQALANPDFIEFMATSLADSILIIEDAENVLKPRGAGETQAISNILNISDGILGDAISSVIICTFNEKIENVDQALLRAGRLIASYEFKHLAVDKTNKLLQNLYQDKYYEATQPMTLAEIFNKENMPMMSSVKRKTVGFT